MLSDVCEGVAIEFAHTTLVVFLPFVPFEVQLLIFDVTERSAANVAGVLRILVDQHVFSDVRPLTAPVVAEVALERLVRVMRPDVSLEMRFARELLGADTALKQHISWHVHHLHMHLQDVLVLTSKHACNWTCSGYAAAPILPNNLQYFWVCDACIMYFLKMCCKRPACVIYQCA